ncbi:MAG TPA: HD domain-containing phosphohydrolase [Actinomycetota bacterium]|nr:HD domain-containing phosphohydrolase [Actinomycetota bacterium]
MPNGLLDGWRSVRSRWKWWASAAIAAVIGLIAWMVHASGGTPNPLVHLLVLPIIAAGIIHKVPGGMIAGLAAGLVVGPWAGAAEPAIDWTSRTAFFVLIGGFVGQSQTLLERHVQNGEHLVKKIATVHARTLSTFASTVELRDKPTGGHSSRVAHNARAVGMALGLDRDELRAVYWAGLLHDLGKIAIPEHILQKPSALNEDEFRTMRRHSDIGADLLLSVSPELRPIADGIRSHHERWDGSGYPRSLSGERIPLVGRVVSVVDVFEALTCKRPYREPRPVSEVLAFVRDRAGVWFDPMLVRITEDLYWKGEIFTADMVREALPMEEPAAMLPDDPDHAALLRAVAASDHHLGSSGRP